MERGLAVGKWQAYAPYVHKNSDMEPVHRGRTKHRIELLHNAPMFVSPKPSFIEAWLHLKL